MKKYDRFDFVGTYYYKDGFCVDVQWDNKDKYWLAFLYHEDYGTKELMFGTPETEPHGKTTLENHLELVGDNIEDYIDRYIKEYAPELA